MVLENCFLDDNYARHLGIELLEVREGAAKARLTIKDCHLNGMSVVHGGAIFSLAAWTFALAANEGGNLAIGINASISFLQAAREGELLAEAKEVGQSKRIATYAVEVTNGNGTLVATFTGMAYRKRER